MSMRYLILFCVLLSSIAVQAQEMGHIKGFVRDAGDGLGLPGANVVIQGTAIGVATDINGLFRFQNLEPGVYTLEAHFIGFETQVREITIDAGVVSKIAFVLEGGGMSDDGESMRYEHPIISRWPFASRIISGDDIRNLPIAW